MTPEERQILIQTSRMVEENNKLLRKMHRAAIWGRIMHFLYWLIIIGLSFGAFYLIQPYVETVQKSIGGFKSDVNNVRGAAGQIGELSGLLKELGN